MAKTPEELLKEATKLIEDIALNKSGIFDDEQKRATDFVAKAHRYSERLPLAA